MSVSWPAFFGSAALIFIVLNASFAFLYFLGNQSVANTAGSGTLELFYFSIETLTTVGCGDMQPQTDYGHFIAAVEIFTGMSFLAVMTGLGPCPLFATASALHLRPPPGRRAARGSSDADDPHRQCAA
jgi:inward rectifier potassium channel